MDQFFKTPFIILDLCERKLVANKLSFMLNFILEESNFVKMCFFNYENVNILLFHKCLVFAAKCMTFGSLTKLSCVLKADSTAQEIRETKAYMAGFGNGSDRPRPIDFFPMSNGSVETDSQAHYTGDVKVCSVGIHNGSNGLLQSELKGHGTSNMLAYSFGLGNVSNHSIDLFSTSIGTDLEAHGGMNAFSSFSDGSAVSNGSIKAETEAHDTGDLKAKLSGYSESANGSTDLFTLSNGSIDLFATANGISDITHKNEVESNYNPSTCAQNGVETNEDFGEFTDALSDSGSKQVVYLCLTICH